MSTATQSIYSKGSVFMSEHISTGSLKIAAALTGSSVTYVAAKELPHEQGMPMNANGMFVPQQVGIHIFGLPIELWCVILPAAMTTLFTLWQMAFLVPKTILAIEEWRERRKSKKRRKNANKSK